MEQRDRNRSEECRADTWREGGDAGDTPRIFSAGMLRNTVYSSSNRCGTLLSSLQANLVLAELSYAPGSIAGKELQLGCLPAVSLLPYFL